MPLPGRPGGHAWNGPGTALEPVRQTPGRGRLRAPSTLAGRGTAALPGIPPLVCDAPAPADGMKSRQLPPAGIALDVLFLAAT